MKLVLHIDRLVLRGVPDTERDATVHALQAALAREFAAPGTARSWAASGHRERVGERFAATPGTLVDAAARTLAKVGDK